MDDAMSLNDAMSLDDAVTNAAAVLRAGGAAVFPTDTDNGFGAGYQAALINAQSVPCGGRE